MQHPPAKAGAGWASQQWARLQAANRRTDRNLLAALRDNLPPSVRPLLGLPDIAESVDKTRSALEWWERAVRSQTPGSRRRAFLEAGQREAQERYRVH